MKIFTAAILAGALALSACGESTATNRGNWSFCEGCREPDNKAPSGSGFASVQDFIDGGLLPENGGAESTPVGDFLTEEDK